MAEILSPGVFIEEIPAQVNVVQAVSTSNLGAVGFTPRGPVDEATLVTSYEQFTRIFGGLTVNSQLPLSMAAYFANGGRRAFVVRVVPGDAVKASSLLESIISDQQIETGNGTTGPFAKTAGTTTLHVNGGASPIKANSVTIRWRNYVLASALLAQATKTRAGAALVCDGIKTVYEGRLDPATLPTFDNALPAVASDVVFHWLVVAVPKTLTVTYPVSGWVSTVTTADGTITVDFRTGRFSFSGTGAPAAAGITADYTPASATKTAVDNGVGGLTGDLAAPGTLSLTDGSYSFSTPALQLPKGPIVINYTINAWALTATSKGVWGNDLKVDVLGNIDYYDLLTATYSRFNVYVRLYNSSTLAYEIVETHEELDFTDPTAATFFADVLNELSDYVDVTDPGGNEPPAQLAGVAYSQVLAAGDALAASQTVVVTGLPGLPVQQRSVRITYTATGGVAKVITDDGNGNLIGDVDPTGNNTVVYSTGALDFKTSATIAVNTVLTAAWRTNPVDTYQVSFASGSDGTFDSTNYSRAQFTSPTLSPTYQGVYALSRIDEIMQVAIPDFAGDVTITGDLLDYADARAALPQGGDRFIILAVPQGSSAQDAVDWVRYTLGRFSKWAAIYWPWLKVADPLLNGRAVTLPPLMHVAGVYARTDQNRNVGKSPGGTVDGALSFLVGLEMTPTQGERDMVYPNRINPLISGANTGLAVWGVRTLSNQSEWRYINVRRLFMFLEKSVFNSTHWIVFENNGPGLWSKIKTQLNGFLSNLFNQGYLAGTKPSEAFFVICDQTNNDQNSINLGQVIIDIGVAANKPAEFVRFRFQQATL